ncbi:MAG: S9 family peptidase [Gemmatimonadota bacterium]|nr:S9 family peptidase [Gemmatimonadota bacterium]
MTCIRSLLFGTVSLTLTGGALLAQERTTAGIVDLINLPTVGSPELSPDGSQIVFTRGEADWAANRTVTHLWRVDADGSNLIQLTSGELGESSPAWSPDGTRIAFTARRGEDDDAQIYLLDTRGGEAIRLTDHPTSVQSISWTPDGESLYFLASDDKPEALKKREELKDDVFAFDENFQHTHLWRVSVDDRSTVRLTEGDYSINGYNLSRDGTMIAFDRGPTPLFDDNDDGEVWVMSSEGTGAIRLTDNSVPEYGPELSPDNRWVLYLADSSLEGEFYYNDKVYVVPASGGEPRLVMPDFGHEVSRASWSGEDGQILFQANTGVRQELFSVELESGLPVQITLGDHSVSWGSYQPALDRFAVTITSPEEPGDVWLVSGDGGPPQRVTRINADAKERYALPRVEAIQWAGADGVEVEGLLYYPLDYLEGERYPLVVQTHGGPASSDRFRFPSSHNYETVLTGLGYFILKPNYRGSTGYGDDFLRNMVGNYFDQAHLDVMAGVDHLVAQGLVDETRMAKMGWSAGGHMTNKIITHTDRFKAASSGAGAANWVSMYAQSDVRIYRTPWFGTTPWEEGANIEQYWQDSPLREAWKVSTPTLFLVGEEDARVPMPQSVEMYRALKHNGVPTHLYVAPRQGHGWQELRHRLYKANVELDWFERWVRDRTWMWEEAPGTESRPVS